MSENLAKPQTRLAAVLRGDTWRGLGSVTVKKNNVPLNLTGASALMQLRRSPRHGKVVASWSTADGSIVLTDAANGALQVMGRVMNVAAGDYAYDLQLTLADGSVLTIVQGMWCVLQDVSR